MDLSQINNTSGTSLHLLMENTPSKSDDEESKRKRSIGQFVCNEVNCGKIFTRSEHLKRHKLNHNPKVIFRCPWPGCNKTFVRKDLKERHNKRHELKKIKHELNEGEVVIGGVGGGISGGVGIGGDGGIGGGVELVNEPVNVIQQIAPQLVPRKDAANDLISWLFNEQSPDLDLYSVPNTHGPDFFTTQVNPLDEFLINMPMDAAFSFNGIPDRTSPLSTISNNSNNTSIPNSTILPPNLQMNEALVIDLNRLIPSLTHHPYMNNAILDSFLTVYWVIFYPQFPTLHKPTFDMNDTQPLLILSMIVLGARYIECVDGDEEKYGIDLTHLNYQETNNFARKIAFELRSLLFQHPEFRTPIKLWVIQTLLQLEIYEKYCSDRELHERAHIHHCTTIQLLRRSPSLGGNPDKKLDETSGNGTSNGSNKVNEEELFKQWIESESMKRVAFLAFIIDTFDAIIFGHQITLFAHQIQLTLPCDDEIWALNNFKTIINKQKSLKTPVFITFVKKMFLSKEHINFKLTNFNRKILLGGLMSILLQLQQRDLQNSFLGLQIDEDFSRNWKETVSVSLDRWRNNLDGGGCCCHDIVSGSGKLYYRQLRSTTCKNSAYHMSHIILSISHYDLYIFCGATLRMNVAADVKDYELVCSRIDKWVDDLNGTKAVIHSYLLLWETFLSEDDEGLDYEVDKDVFRNNHVVYLAFLVVWTYNFNKCGMESNLLSQVDNGVTNELKFYEDGYEYLRRMRKEFIGITGVDLTRRKYSGDEYYKKILEYCGALPRIVNKKAMVGLCYLLSNKYMNSKWELNLESGRLIQNCGERSMGRKRVKCYNMYD